MSPAAQAELAAYLSLVAAVIIIPLCVPVWLVLRRYRFTNWLAAAVLGFGATLAYWIVTNQPSDLPGNSALDLARSGLPLAVCGAIAGIATWWAGSSRSAAQSSSSS